MYGWPAHVQSGTGSLMPMGMERSPPPDTGAFMSFRTPQGGGSRGASPIAVRSPAPDPRLHRASHASVKGAGKGVFGDKNLQGLVTTTDQAAACRGGSVSSGGGHNAASLQVFVGENCQTQSQEASGPNPPVSDGHEASATAERMGQIAAAEAVSSAVLEEQHEFQRLQIRLVTAQDKIKHLRNEQGSARVAVQAVEKAFDEALRDCGHAKGIADTLNEGAPIQDQRREIITTEVQSQQRRVKELEQLVTKLSGSLNPTAPGRLQWVEKAMTLDAQLQDRKRRLEIEEAECRALEQRREVTAKRISELRKRYAALETAYGGVDVRIEEVRSPDGSFDPATLVLALARAVMGLSAQDPLPGNPSAGPPGKQRPPLLPQGNQRTVERRPSQPLYRVRLSPEYSPRSPRLTTAWSPAMSARSRTLLDSVGSLNRTRSAPSLHEWHPGIRLPAPGPTTQLQDISSQLYLPRLPPLQPAPLSGACLVPANVPSRLSLPGAIPSPAAPFLPSAKRLPLGDHVGPWSSPPLMDHTNSGAAMWGIGAHHDDAMAVASVH